jgi:hypothetical protein
LQRQTKTCAVQKQLRIRHGCMITMRISHGRMITMRT